MSLVGYERKCPNACIYDRCWSKADIGAPEPNSHL